MSAMQSRKPLGDPAGPDAGRPNGAAQHEPLESDYLDALERLEEQQAELTVRGCFGRERRELWKQVAMAAGIAAAVRPEDAESGAVVADRVLAAFDKRFTLECEQAAHDARDVARARMRISRSNPRGVVPMPPPFVPEIAT